MLTKNGSRSNRSNRLLSLTEGFNRFAPFIMGIRPFQWFQSFNRSAPFKMLMKFTGHEFPEISECVTSTGTCVGFRSEETLRSFPSQLYRAI
jgi:hypothetical protein